jgi:hypothetical protein
MLGVLFSDTFFGLTQKFPFHFFKSCPDNAAVERFYREKINSPHYIVEVNQRSDDSASPQRDG